VTHQPAIILAAGKSRRMGQPKALLPFRQGTFLSTLAETLAEFCVPIVAVFGHGGETLSASVPPGVTAVLNPDYECGMLTSLQAGLRAVDFAGARRILFTLVDHPAISVATIAALLNSEAPIAIPRFEARRGHPVVIRPEIAREFLDEPQTAKVRYTIDRHAAEIEYIDVPDPAINDDIDDPGLYLQLLQREAARH
jgi:CTP:molybdopterin cytidylyltransferase MocA